MLSQIFINGSYYIIAVLVLFWGQAAIRFLKVENEKRSRKRRLRIYGPGVVLALLLATVSFIAVPPFYRTLSDETNLLSVAQSLFQRRTAELTVMGVHYYGNFNPIISGLPTRPILFPFLVSLIHSLLGYHWQNGFVLNYFCLVVLLSVVFVLFRRSSTIFVAFAAQILILSCPIVIISATSAGFDLLFTVLLFWGLVTVFVYLEGPSAEKFGLLVSTILVFCHTRYEAAALAPLFILSVIFSGRFSRSHLKGNKSLLAFAPFSLVPVIAQRILMHGDYQNDPGVDVFSWNHFKVHSFEFLKSQFSWSPNLPHAPLLNIAAFLVLSALMYFAMRGQIRFQNRFSKYNVVFSTLVVSVCFIIYLAYYFGRYTHPSSTRFFLTQAIAAALALPFFHVMKPNLLSQRALLGLAFAFFFYYQPIAVENRFMNSLVINRETEQEIDFMGTCKNKDILIITDRPGQFTVMNFGAIDFSYAQQNSIELIEQMKSKLFSSVLTFQKINYETKRPIAGNGLEKHFRLHQLKEIQLTEKEYLRISEVVLASSVLSEKPRANRRIGDQL